MSEYRQMQFWPMSSQADSRAKTSATPGKAKASSVSVPASGRRCFDSFEMYGRRGQLLKMYQPFDLKGLPWSFKISARSGIALNGTVYPLLPLARLTAGTGSGSWPTPCARDYKDCGPNVNWEKVASKGKLAGAVMLKMWPTPCANTRPNEGNVRLLRAKVEAGELTREEAKAMLNGKDPFEAQGAVPQKMWPTPDASPHKYRLRGDSQQSESLNGVHGGKLNPTWVEWLMGFPIGWTDLSNSETQ